jgi:hypothetical protein
VQIVDDHHQRSAAAQVFEELAYRPEGLLGPAASLGQPHRRSDPAADQVGLLLAGEQRSQLALCRLEGVVERDPGRLANHLGDRPVRDALPIGQTPAAQDRGALADAGERLVHQPGLAHPGGAQHGHQPAGALGHHSVEGVQQQLAFRLAAHHGDVAAPGVARNIQAHPQQAPGRHLLRLALEGQRRDRLGLDRIPHQLPRRLADQHLAWGSRLLQARGHVYRVAQHQRAASPSAPGDHLPGVHPGANAEGHAPVALQLLVELSQRRRQLDCGPHRPQGVVLVQPGTPNTPTTASPMNFSTVP